VRYYDKIGATRRKDKWTGGHPLLGYDVEPKGLKLVINEDEAVRVRAIFASYLVHESLLPVVKELHRRGWASKRWVRNQRNEDCCGPRQGSLSTVSDRWPPERFSAPASREPSHPHRHDFAVTVPCSGRSTTTSVPVVSP
jgi:hypothetical protein